MKRFLPVLAAGMMTLTSCGLDFFVRVKDPITISSPSPTEQITKVSLDATQQEYVKAGNTMAFRFLGQLYDGEDLVCSPLSLQYAMAMVANGATGQTRQEIIDFLGYGEEGIDALNSYCKTLLELLPAVDLEVALKVTDALIVNDEFPLQPSFRKTVEENYYAAVDNMDFTEPKQVAARINDWSKRSTNGLISKILDADEISEDAVAYIMNALYFKAKWNGTKYDPMFREEDTKAEYFTLADGRKVKVDMMRNVSRYKYAEMDGYKVVAIPYAGCKFYMYILLPDTNDLDGLIGKLQVTSWNDILSGLKQDADVHLKIPKFDIENRFILNDALMSLGVEKAFDRRSDEFDEMFENDDYYYWIEKVIQKSRISVSEWGTEAASVTIVEMGGETAGPPDELKEIHFYADRPFVFLIGEATSGTILFEGTFTNSQR
jgi:serpin B